MLTGSQEPTSKSRRVRTVEREGEETFQPERSWRQKFNDAFRGVKLGVRGQSSFFAHFFIASLVVVCAFALEAELWHWCVLLLSIGLVLTAEMFNSALEHLAKAISTQHNRHIGRALDIASGAVLLASLTAAAVGLFVFGQLVYRAFALLAS